MKKIIISAISMAIVLVSCNQKSKESETTNTPMMENEATITKDSTMMENDTTITKDSKTKLYACPMHPEAQGKLNDKCPKCGMKLSEEVK